MVGEIFAVVGVSLWGAVLFWRWVNRRWPRPVVLRASVPEPPPLDRGALVTPELLAWLDALDTPGAREAADLVRQRDAFGRAKYGQGLRVDDGRDGLEDLRQELGDALQYAYKERMRGGDLSAVQPVLAVLARLVLGDDL